MATCGAIRKVLNESSRVLERLHWSDPVPRATIWDDSEFEMLEHEQIYIRNGPWRLKFCLEKSELLGIEKWSGEDGDYRALPAEGQKR